MGQLARLQMIVDSLNDCQCAYLLAVYFEDQVREAASRQQPRSSPANEWRWTEYGPVGAAHLDSARLLRSKLKQAGLVDQGTGAPGRPWPKENWSGQGMLIQALPMPGPD